MGYHRSMADLYVRLAEAGFERRFVLATALPWGWYDARANKPEGRAEAEASIAAATGIERDRLGDPAADLGLDPSAPERFLTRRLAELTARCLPVQRAAWVADLDAAQLRRYVLNEHRVVRLASLVKTCWGLGVPVVHLSRLPRGARRSESESDTIRVDGVPIVVLNGAAPARAWLLWSLAERLAELASTDQDAREFADRLVLGDEPFALEGPDRITGVKLASLARDLSRSRGAEIGALVARFALGKADLGVNARGPARRALRSLGIEVGGGALIRRASAAHLDRDRLDPAARRFFDALTGLDDDTP